MNRDSTSAVLPTAVAGYAALLVVQSMESEYRWALLGFVVALFFALREAARLHKLEALRGPESSTRALLFGATLFSLSRFAPAGTVDILLGSGGLLLVTGATFFSVARAEGPRGLLSGHPAAASLDGLVVSSALWALPLTFSLAEIFAPSSFSVSAETLRLGIVFSSLGSLFLLGSVLLRVIVLRGLELGVLDRAKSAMSLAIAGAMIVLSATLVGVGDSVDVVPFTVLFVSLLAYLALSLRSAEQVTSLTRGLTALFVFTAPIVLFGGYVVLKFPERPVTTLTLTAVLAAFSGVLARALARPLGASDATWLSAVELASERALHPDPKMALREVLLALVPLDRKGTTRPELYVLDPPTVLCVDIAGYLTERRVEFPLAIHDLATNEPDHVLRFETLERAQIRRPLLQASVAWFEVRKTKAVVALRDDVGPVGLLLCPRGQRTTNLTLEEVRLLGRLGERVTNLLTHQSSVTRAELLAMSEREKREETEVAAEKLREELGENRALLSNDAEALDRELLKVARSPSARFCLEELETRKDSPLVLVTPTGVDPRGFSAHYHLANGANGESGPLVFLDASSEGLRSELAFEKSPELAKKLALGARGTLVVESAHALSDFATRDLAERLRTARFRCLLSMSDATLLKSPLKELASGKPIKLPSLADRGEDLMAIVISELTRLGLAKNGAPLGLARPLMMELLDRTYVGNEEELRSLLFRGACRATGEVISREDIFGDAELATTEDDDEPRRARARVPPRSYRRS